MAASLYSVSDGVALGGVSLVSVWSGEGWRPSEGRPPDQLAEILRLAYGAQSPEVVRRCHRGLKRAAAQLEAGDLARAGSLDLTIYNSLHLYL